MCVHEFVFHLSKPQLNEGQGVRMCVCLVHSRSRCRTRGTCDEDDHPQPLQSLTVLLTQMSPTFSQPFAYSPSPLSLSHYFSPFTSSVGSRSGLRPQALTGHAVSTALDRDSKNATSLVWKWPIEIRRWDLCVPVSAGAVNTVKQKHMELN